MAPKNLVSRKKRPPQDEARTPVSKQSDDKTDSDSDGEAAAAAAPLVPPKKPKFVAPLKQPGPEPVESGSACSSPSASGFIIVPRAEEKAEAKSKAKKKGKGSASKVFSEDDVISLLKGLAVFWANGKNNKWAEFHLFVKNDLGNQFTKTQVSEKIRHLKKKFDSNSERARANGGRIDLSDPHESAVFELSKALWGDEKGEKSGNGDEEANEMITGKENEEVVEKDEGSKKRKKRKQVSEDGEENEKKMPEHGVEELVEEGDVRDAANTILSIKKLVDENGEGSKKAKKKKKKKKKSKEGDELDEKKELVKEDIQVEVNDEGNEISSKEKQADGGSKRKEKKTKKTKKMKLVDECGEENKSIGEQKEVDEHAEKSLKEVDHHEEEEEEEREEEREEELLKEGKQVDEHEQQEKRHKKKKQVDGHDKKKVIAEPVDGHGKENSKPTKEKQELAIGLDEFQSAYPLLYASFNCPEYPKVAMDKCVGIGRDNAQELEEKLREIHAQMHRLELKKLDLMSCQ